jgi:hypothetical protein
MDHIQNENKDVMINVVTQLYSCNRPHVAGENFKEASLLH